MPIEMTHAVAIVEECLRNAELVDIETEINDDQGGAFAFVKFRLGEDRIQEAVSVIPYWLCGSHERPRHLPGFSVFVRHTSIPKRFQTHVELQLGNHMRDRAHCVDKWMRYLQAH